MVRARMSVVITGSSSGIGAACVETFQNAGFHVIGVDAADASGADVHHVVDLSTDRCGDEVARLLKGTEIEALVNNAAFVEYATALDTETSIWDRILAVNLRAPFLVSKALYPSLRETRGAVVNVGSVHAIATSPGVAAYAASKGGLVALTRALAVEWAPEVRVNCVLPGAVDTAMLADGLSRSGLTVEELGAKHALGRVGSPKEIAEAIVFLANSRFITGAALTVDGGATARLSTE
jgi:NAD(P)-dependent dehydrogenase (short-subunit alcohol dehydrogenase family)